MIKIIICKCCKKKVKVEIVKSSNRQYCKNCARHTAMIRSKENEKYNRALKEMQEKYRYIDKIREVTNNGKTDSSGNIE